MAPPDTNAESEQCKTKTDSEPAVSAINLTAAQASIETTIAILHSEFRRGEHVSIFSDDDHPMQVIP
jgi:hypothetical protein